MPPMSTASMKSVRIEVLGCAVDNLTIDETIERVKQFVASGGPHQHVVVNVDKIVKAARDPALRRAINACDLINVDGMPVVWASRLLGTPLKERVTGVDLFERLLAVAAQQGWSVYLLGATDDVVNRVGTLAQQRFPGLRVAGARNGYWRPEEDEQVARAVSATAPELLFVAISSPKKEQFLSRYLQLMGAPFAMGVGGTFDVFAGKVRRAPMWMQRSGLEWFYRFLQEPRRMFRRYFVEDLYFFRLLARELMRGKGSSG